MLKSLPEKPFRISGTVRMPQKAYFPRYEIENISYYLPLAHRDLVRFFRELVMAPVKRVDGSPNKVGFSNFLRLANVRYYLFDDGAQNEKAKLELDHLQSDMVNNGLLMKAKGSNFLIFEDTKAFDRYRIVSNLKVIKNDQDTLNFLKQKSGSSEDDSIHMINL